MTETSDQFNEMLARLAAAPHPAEHDAVDRFLAGLDAYLAGLTDDQHRFLWTCLEQLMGRHGVQVDSPLGLRLMYTLLLYGYWLGQRYVAVPRVP